MDQSKTLSLLYEEIKDLTAQGALVYDKIEYVRQNGALPKPPSSDSSVSMDYGEIKDRIRRLNDFICKTKKKLQPSAKPASLKKQNEWQIKLAEAEMEREVLNKKKREIEHARS